jgi:plastocyanin
MMKFYKATLSAFLLFAFCGASAQTTHEVSVVNFAFQPASLTIQVGDVVRWTNQEGMHNVGTSAYPDNPESFGNEISASNWVYEFTFTEVGTNQYQCDAHPGPMQGTIIVEDNSLSAEDANDEAPFKLYPNPVSDILYWSWSETQAISPATFQLFDLTGKVVAEFSMSQKGSYPVSDFASGLYWYRVDMGNGLLKSGKLLIQPR